MSALMDDRTRLLEALIAAGIRTATTGKLAAPVVHVEPGDPWSRPVRLGHGARRESSWRLTAIAGRVDSDGAFATLGDLLEGVDTALLLVPGAQLPTWSKPTDYSIDGVPYAACVATVQVTSA